MSEKSSSRPGTRSSLDSQRVRARSGSARRAASSRCGASPSICTISASTVRSSAGVVATLRRRAARSPCRRARAPPAAGATRRRPSSRPPPPAGSPAKTSSLSTSVSVAVGSSRITSRACWPSAFAISTSCRSPMLSVGQRLVRVDALQADVVEHPAAARDRRPPAVDQRHVDVAEQHVLQHGQRRHDAELLVDERHAEPLRGLAAAQVDRLAVDEDPALVRRQLAGQHLHDGALAGAVVPAQAVDLAGADGERDVPHRRHAAEAPGEALHADARHRPRARSRGSRVAALLGELVDVGGRDPLLLDESRSAAASRR